MSRYKIHVMVIIKIHLEASAYKLGEELIVAHPITKIHA
jgi:hypothetical protein